MGPLRMDFLHCALLAVIVIAAVYAFGSFREGIVGPCSTCCAAMDIWVNSKHDYCDAKKESGRPCFWDQVHNPDIKTDEEKFKWHQDCCTAGAPKGTYKDECNWHVR